MRRRMEGRGWDLGGGGGGGRHSEYIHVVWMG